MKLLFNILLVLSLLLSADHGTCAITPFHLVPDRDIHIIDGERPQWKMLWDKARQLVSLGKYDAAVLQYEALLASKGNIQEARWELARIYMHLKHWDEAAALLELLMEADPGRGAYLNGLGRVMWEKGLCDRAVDLFQKARKLNPADVEALVGLTEGLLKLNRRQEALPYLEHLHNLQPDNIGIYRYLALLYFELGLYEKARIPLMDLAEMPQADQEILLRTAQVHDKLELDNIAGRYWRRVLERDASNKDAHLRLADISDKEEHFREALSHLLFLLDDDPRNTDLLARAGKAYMEIDEPEKALGMFNRYLAIQPDSPEILRAIVQIQAALGNKAETLATLEEYFQVESDTGAADLKLAASLYDGAGRFHEAIPLYRKLIELSPEDPDLLASLASDLLAIGENEGALSLWKHLAQVVKDPLAVYRPMAELLTRLDRQSELIEVLGKIHELNPDDLSTVMRLADLHLARKEVDVARGYFEKLSLIGYQQGDFLVSKGRLHELLQQPEHALRCYEAFVKTNPDRFEVRLRVADLAASLGFFSEAGTQLDDLLAMGNKTTAFITEIQLLKAKALREAGFLQAAVEEYRHIISGKGGVASPQQRMLAWQGLAANYHAAGLYYEEEQVLREALADGQTAIEFTKSLFDIAILTGRSDDAEVWLKEMRRQYRRSTGTDFDGQITDWQLRLLEIKLLSVRGGYRIAVRKCRQLFSEFSANRTILNQVGEERQPRLAIGLALCRIYLEDDKLDQAAKLAGTLLDEGWRDYEIFVLLQQVYTLRNASAGEVQEVADMMSREFWDGDLHSADLSNFFILANLYGDYGNKGLQERFAQAAHQRAPDSLKATLLLGQVLIAQSRMREAESLLAVVREHFSGNVIALSELTKIMFKSGRFDEALVLCDAVLDQQLRPDMLLLKARITWSKYRWSEALNIYKSYLEPSVNALLAEQIANHGIVLELAPKKTWWQSFTFTEGKSPEVAEVVMSPHFIVDKSDENRRINSFSAPLYARYRWQQNFAEEFAAKRSVQRRQYNQAVSQHETLLASFADEDSLLYDLAELYGRLDRSEEEAILYEKLQRINPNFPGLDAAMQRNRLKRRPQLSSGYGQITEEGWDNYKSISRKWGELSTRFSPETGHEVSVSLSRINYQDTINQDNQLWAKRAVASYQATVVSGLSAAFSIGIEDPDEDFPSTEVFALSVQGRIGDALKSHLTLTRDVTPDTVASIKRKIGHDLYEAGMAVDFFPRLTLGTDIGQKKFTDGNQTDLYTFWSSYVFFFDPTYLRFRFSYDLQDSRYPPNPGPALSDGFGAEDHPYYSPKAYWLSEFSLLFRHQLPSDTFGRGTLKYYTLEYAWGYDSHEDRLQSMAASLFLELRQHFTVKVSAAVRDLKSYESKELFLTAIYRW